MNIPEYPLTRKEGSETGQIGYSDAVFSNSFSLTIWGFYAILYSSKEQTKACIFLTYMPVETIDMPQGG